MKKSKMIDGQIEKWADILDEDETSVVNYPAPSYPIEPFVVHVTDDKLFLKTYRNEIFDLIQNAYSNKGGFYGADNPRTLIKDTDRAKIVFDKDGSIIACALYRTDKGGVKRFGSAGISGNRESLKAVSDIIKSDIEPYDGWYWVEASGIIEKLFGKNGGNPIPNSISRFLLEIDDDDSFRIDETDKFHYYRTIDGSEKRKMIFGFKDEETKRMAEEAVENYGEFKLSIGTSKKRITESENKIYQKMEESRKFLSRLYDFHYEEKCNEMLPEWKQMLLDSISFIKKNLGTVSENKREMYRSAIRRGNTCLESMTVLDFKKISIK